jgi:hypothetical protein
MSRTFLERSNDAYNSTNISVYIVNPLKFIINTYTEKAAICWIETPCNSVSLSLFYAPKDKGDMIRREYR